MINLHFIRAAIEANTGVRLTLPRVRELLVEEGLITQRQADAQAKIFSGYAPFFELEERTRPVSDIVDTEMGLPDNQI